MTAGWTRSADILVIGFGISAGPIASRLHASDHDFRAEILERGELWDPSEEGHSRRSGKSIPLEDDFVEVASEEGASRQRRWWSADSAGGGSLLWYGQLSRFHSTDLAMRTNFGDDLGSEIRDWPLEHEELLRRYGEAEALLSPLGCGYGFSAEEYRRLDCETFVARSGPSDFERSVIDRLHASGIKGYVGQSCLGGRAWERKPVSPLDGTLGDARRPLMSRPNLYARLYPQITGDSRFRLTGSTYATRLLHSRGRVEGAELLERLADGGLRKVRVKAPIVVLAAGPLETVRILLSSELPDRSRLIGRRMTFTLERVAYLRTRLKRQRPAAEDLDGLFSNVVIKDYYDYRTARGVRKGGKFALYDALVAETPERHAKNLGLTGSELARHIASEQDTYGIKVSFKGESVPSPDKYVTLSAHRNRYGTRVPRINYRAHPHDVALQEDISDVFGTLAGALDTVDMRLKPAPRGPEAVSAHHHGGAVFGEDPADSVLDPGCESHEVKGLFVADASFMPTSGGTNSSLTTMANAIRIAGPIVARIRS